MSKLLVAVLLAGWLVVPTTLRAATHPAAEVNPVAEVPDCRKPESTKRKI